MAQSEQQWTQWPAWRYRIRKSGSDNIVAAADGWNDANQLLGSSVVRNSGVEFSIEKYTPGCGGYCWMKSAKLSGG